MHSVERTTEQPTQRLQASATANRSTDYHNNHSNNLQGDYMTLYKIVSIEDKTVVDERLTYDETLLYHHDETVLVVGQDANIEKVFAFIASEASKNV